MNTQELQHIEWHLAQALRWRDALSAKLRQVRGQFGYTAVLDELAIEANLEVAKFKKQRQRFLARAR